MLWFCDNHRLRRSDCAGLYAANVRIAELVVVYQIDIQASDLPQTGY